MACLKEGKASIDALYDYTLVIFVHRGRRKKVEDIEVIPTNWLSVFNNKVFTSYMHGKIEGEHRELLEDLIKSRADAPSDWPSFHVKIIGRAKDYKEALAKSITLEQEESVLTCDSDEEVQDVQKEMITALKQRDFLRLQADLFAKINPTVPAEIGTKNEKTVSSESEIRSEKTADEIQSTAVHNNNEINLKIRLDMTGNI